jgi:hypothetical protein
MYDPLVSLLESGDLDTQLNALVLINTMLKKLDASKLPDKRKKV